MKITKEMSYTRPILDVAAWLSQQDPTTVIEGIKLFLYGDVPSSFIKIGWTPTKDRPERSEFIIMDGMYWSPTMQYNLDHLTSHLLVNKTCPNCGSKYHIFDVTINCPKSNPNGWKSRLECSNLDCLNEEYDTEYRQILFQRYGTG